MEHRDIYGLLIEELKAVVSDLQAKSDRCYVTYQEAAAKCDGARAALKALEDAIDHQMKPF